MKLLQGSELAGFIKERQARQVRSLRQTAHVVPRLAIVLTVDNPVINRYIALKQVHGTEIGIEVDVHQVTQSEAPQKIATLNDDPTVHGIIVQLPLANPDETETVVNSVTPAKDVDGLGRQTQFDTATALAIVWLLAGYNVELRGKRIVIIGKGRLVGAPLYKLLKNSNYQVEATDIATKNLPKVLRKADIVITATGSPALITSDMLRLDAVVVDAGVATDAGKLVGDVAPEVYDRPDITITPKIGGVGPLTVTALFDNVIRAATDATSA